MYQNIKVNYLKLEQHRQNFNNYVFMISVVEQFKYDNEKQKDIYFYANHK